MGDSPLFPLDSALWDDDTPAADLPERFQLTLYVKRGSSRCTTAIRAIRKICQEDLAGRVDLRVVDIALHPEALEADQVLTIPTLIKRLPKPLRRIVGDLSREEVVRAALDIAPAPP
ncbi:MAG: circadian clock KaiB family protein [Synechococcus sp.]